MQPIVGMIRLQYPSLQRQSHRMLLQVDPLAWVLAQIYSQGLGRM